MPEEAGQRMETYRDLGSKAGERLCIQRDEGKEETKGEKTSTERKRKGEKGGATTRKG